MSSGDTSLGGERGDFPPTTIGVARLWGAGAADRAAAMETLCRRYWKPIYRYLRIAWAKSNDEAKDLAQAFFLWLIEGEALRRYEPQRGGFRHYLKMILKGFVMHQNEALACLKRGGSVKHIPLDVLEDDAPGAPAESPERAFDREWLDALVKRSIERVRLHFTQKGQEDRFRLFEEHDLPAAGEPPSYEQLAQRHGIAVHEVRDRLFAVREAVRRQIRAELCDVTADDAELEEEWRELFGA